MLLIQVEIDSIVAGSVIVDFHVLAAPDGTPIEPATLTAALTTGITVAGHTVRLSSPPPPSGFPHADAVVRFSAMLPLVRVE